MIKHYYTKEEDEFLKRNVKGTTLKELTKRFNNNFNYTLSESAIANRKNKLCLSSGITGGQFKKGHKPHNKGKKQIEYMAREAIEKTKITRFKKGNKPLNYKPVGSERITRGGYVEVKIEDPNKWQPKHRYIYESMYGKIPANHKVIFADGNINNFEIDNLILVSNAEELIMNNRNLRSNDRELTKAGYNLAKVISKIAKVKNERL